MESEVNTLEAAKAVFEDRFHSMRFFPVKGVPVLKRGTMIIGEGPNAQDWPLAESGLWDLETILGQRQISKSKDYDLIELVTNYLLNKPDSDVGQYQAVISEDQIIGFKHQLKPYIPGHFVIEAITKGLGSAGISCNSFTSDATSFSLAITTDILHLEPHLGDVTNGGVKVKFSDLSYTDVFVTPYTNRLRCTNGAIHAVNGKSTRIPVYSCNPDDVVRKLVESVDYSRKYVAGEVSKQLELSTKLRLDTVQAVMRICAEHRLNEGFLNLVLNFLNQENDGTLYSVVQAFTAAANYQDLSDHEVDVLQNLGGHLLEHAEVPRCTSCYSALPIQ